MWAAITMAVHSVHKTDIDFHIRGCHPCPSFALTSTVLRLRLTHPQSLPPTNEQDASLRHHHSGGQPASCSRYAFPHHITKHNPKQGKLTLSPTAVIAQSGLLAAAANTTATAVTQTITYFDDECTCTKTSITITSCTTTPTAASWSAPYQSTTTWYDHECGCTKSAAVPMPPSMSMGSNYTAPAAPAYVPAMSTSMAAPAPASSSAMPEQYTGNGAGARATGAVLGVAGVFGAAMLMV